MALINIGTPTNTPTGDTLYDAFTKINLIVGNGNGNVSTCTATGIAAMSAVNTGASNTANGHSALSSNTSGYENTAIGRSALQANTTGYYNIAIGSSTQSTGTATIGNTSVGSYSLYNANTGNQNTAIGYGALQNNSNGSGNTAIGYAAISANTIFQNVTGVGAYSVVTGNNELQLGASFATVYSQSAVVVRSDLRDKTEIRDTVLGLDFINELRPVDYKWDMREDYKTEMPSPLSEDATQEEIDAHKIIMDEWIESCKPDNLTHDGTHTRSRYHHGLIAQEVEDVIGASGVDFGGFQDHKIGGGYDVLSIRYEELIAPMIKAIQELTARINVLEGN